MEREQMLYQSPGSMDKKHVQPVEGAVCYYCVGQGGRGLCLCWYGNSQSILSRSASPFFPPHKALWEDLNYTVVQPLNVRLFNDNISLTLSLFLSLPSFLHLQRRNMWRYSHTSVKERMRSALRKGSPWRSSKKTWRAGGTSGENRLPLWVNCVSAERTSTARAFFKGFFVIQFKRNESSESSEISGSRHCLVLWSRQRFPAALICVMVLRRNY